MSRIEYGLGQFGDRRLEKGGSLCMRHWSSGHARVSAGLRERGRGRFNSRVFCAIAR
jgi:hypothetical protein